jgi:hypothetical protein
MSGGICAKKSKDRLTNRSGHNYGNSLAESNCMNSPENAPPRSSPSMIDWKRTIRRTIAKFAVLLLVSSIALPATAFRGSHSSGRSHSGSSSNRATSSAVSRNRHGRIKRSASAKHSFERQHPCLSTGRSSGRCPGYVVDHVKPLECGGADAPSNMQWQTVAAGKAKDKTEGNCRL